MLSHQLQPPNNDMLPHTHGGGTPSFMAYIRQDSDALKGSIPVQLWNYGLKTLNVCFAAWGLRGGLRLIVWHSLGFCINIISYISFGSRRRTMNQRCSMLYNIKAWSWNKGSTVHHLRSFHCRTLYTRIYICASTGLQFACLSLFP